MLPFFFRSTKIFFPSQTPFRKSGIAIFSAAAVLCACGSASSTVRAIFCGSGHSKGLLSVKLNTSFMSSNNIASDNGALLGYLNKALQAVNIPPSALNVKSLESINNDSSDEFRFLKLDGDYGAGFGVATSLFAKALGGTTESVSGTLFSNIRESYSVNAAVVSDSVTLGGILPWSSPQAFFTGTGKPSEKQWALTQTKFDEAYAILNNTQKEVIVAVIDTGVDLQHPDLKPILTKGYNFVDDNDNPQDGNGHGTHCAGIIASQALSGPDAPLGVAARANIKIMPVKVLGNDGSGNSQNIEKGIRWAVKNGANVISMSLGGGVEFKDVQEKALNDPIISKAIAEEKVIILVAAGNENCELGGKCSDSNGLFGKTYSEYTVFPCANEGTICVGATNADEKLASYSNFSSKKTGKAFRTRADINAPGTKIYSTWPTALGGPYKAISGTSMATPYAAGVAALLKANEQPGKPIVQSSVRKILEDGQVFDPDVKAKSETGRLDLLFTAQQFKRFNDSTYSPPSTPLPNPITAPEFADQKGGGGDLAGVLWSAVCK